MRALCVTRHPHLPEHLVRIIGARDLDGTPRLAYDAAGRDADESAPDGVIAGYEWVVAASLGVPPMSPPTSPDSLRHAASFRDA